MTNTELTSAPGNAVNLVQVLQYRACNDRDRNAFIFLRNRGRDEEPLTYGALHQKALNIGANLAQRCQPGDRVLLLYPQGLEYIAAFMGCLYAGVIAVPLYPPRPNQKLDRVENVIESCGAIMALTEGRSLDNILRFFASEEQFSSFPVYATDQFASDGSPQWQPMIMALDHPAFLQYTSGSTGMPKGVIVTHRSLMANENAIYQVFRATAADVSISWLPLYHDMGLIGAVLQAMYAGCVSIIFPSVDFIRSPLLWLQLIHKYRATISGAPDFAYDACVKAYDAQTFAGLDLSSLRLLFNGAEPIRAQTLEAFSQVMAPHGFRSSSWLPCYGMAEITLFVTGGAPHLLRCKADALRHNRIEKADESDNSSLTLVGCGPVHDLIRIAEPEGNRILEPGQIGEIRLGGPSMAAGYWAREELSAYTFGQCPEGESAPYLRTGDLGSIYEGQLYITGRCKDLIIIRGRNYYPQDLELTAERSHPALNNNAAAALAVTIDFQERLILLLEVARDKMRGLDPHSVIEAVRAAISEAHELRVHEVVLLKPGGIAKTSSGKIRRSTCRDLYLAGDLKALATEITPGRAALIDADLPDREALLALDPETRATALTRAITQIIAGVVGVFPADLTPQRVLSSLGVDSMLAIELQHRLEKLVGGTPPILCFWDGSRLETLVGHCLELLEAAGINRLQTGPMPAVFPLSHNQKALWFLYRLAPESTAYNLSFAAEIHAPVSAALVEESFLQVLERHPAVRVQFEEEGGQLQQRVIQTPVNFFQRMDVNGWSEGEIDGWLARRAAEPFSLEHGPLLRVALLERDPGPAILFLSVHHIAFDMWSLLVFMDEWGQYFGGQDLLQAPPGANYAGYVREQEQMLELQGPAALEWWRQELYSPLPVLDLPTDFPRPPVQTYVGDAVGFGLEPLLADRLRKMAVDKQTTLFTLLLSGFQLLLHYYSGQDDIVVGSPSAGRFGARYDRVVGYFVNPMVLRAHIRDVSFSQFLEQVRQTVHGVMTHADYPFELLVEHLHPQRDPSRSPLFQTLFVFQNPHLHQDAVHFALGGRGASMDLAGLRLISRPPGHQTSQFDLSLIMGESGSALDATFEYNTDLFLKETLQRMATHLGYLLEQLVTDPDQALSRFDMLSPEERQLILVTWNQTGGAVATGPLLHRRFEALAARDPHRIVLDYRGQRLTAAALDQRANQLAWQLLDLGLGLEDRVGICRERDPDMIAAMLAVLKAGACYVPLDPAYPEERIAYMLEDAAAALVLTSGTQAARFQAMGQPLLITESLPTPGETPGVPTVAVMGDHTAWIIYTSGSTGKPKGVAIRHHSGAVLADWQASVYDGADLAGVLASTSICFDLSIFEIFGTLALGGRLVLVNNALDLVELDAGLGITLINTVPSAMTELLRLEALPGSLRVVNLAGEPLRARLAQNLHRLPQIRVYNLYGPSEDTTYSVFACIQRDSRLVPPIGRPLTGTAAYLVNPKLRPVPLGAAGELLLGGEGLARGYFRRPGLTAERFVPNPFADPSNSGSRLYRTGDLVSYRPDGDLVFQGRVDFQVKIRGFRIELNEIQVVLDQMPEVSDCLVLVREDQPGNPQITAYVVAGPSVDATALHARASALLPVYMVPSYFVFLKALPLTPNGKVNRSALPVPVATSGALAPPRTRTEERLVGIWSELLNVAQPGVTTGFFYLGGHSLLATRLVSRIRTVFGVNLPLRDVFTHNSIRQQARLIDQLAHEAEGDLAPLVAIPRTGPLELSFGQQRLWFLDQLEGAGGLYNMPVALRLSGKTNFAALRWSLQQITARHEAIRSRFITLEGQPLVCFPEPELDFRVVDMSNVQPGISRDVVQSLTHQELTAPFDLTKGPLLRVLALVLSPKQCRLLVTMHHIISDGWSMNVLVRELETFYGAYHRAGGPPQAPVLPELVIQYADFAVWQRTRLSGVRLEDRLKWWKSELEGSPPLLTLATDRPRPAVQTFEGARFNFEINPDRFRAAVKVCEDTGTTLFMVLESVFALLMARYSGQDDLVIGTPIAGRESEEVEGLIGFFVNSLPLRSLPGQDGSQTFRQLLLQTRDRALDAYAHQDVPFELIVEAIQAPRDLSYPPLIQVMFALQNLSMKLPQLPDLEITALDTGTVVSRFDLSMVLFEEGGGYRGELEYNTVLFEPATIQRLSRHYQILLDGICRDMDQRLSGYRLLEEAERRCILEQWNNSSNPWSGTMLIHEIIADFAAKEPDRLAAAFVEGQRVTRLSYGQFNQRAEALARVLVDEGVGPDVFVGIMAERSLERLIAMLAVLKAGGAWVPLDPALPPERLAMILQDTGLQVMFAQQPPPFRAIRYFDLNQLPESSTSQPVGLRGFAESTAYGIFTSGSTGRPKGVLTPHAGLLNLARCMADQQKIAAGDRVLQFASFGFDASVLEMFPAFWAGASVWLAPKEVLMPGAGLYQLLEQQEITHCWLPPSVLSHLVQGLPPSVVCLSSGSEALEPGHAQRFADQLRFLNLYGPTEASVISVGAPIYNDGRIPPIGRPIWNMQAYVMNPRMRLLPPGLPGELVLGGLGLARGYLNQPAQTASRFVPDPYGDRGTRLYRTGDLVRFLADGQLLFMGRVDHQVKLRGFRIELDEVTSNLVAHPQIREAVTLCERFRPGADAMLVGYVLPEPGLELDADQLKQNLLAFMAQRLPAYMLPSALVILEQMPRTPGGKINRRALPEPVLPQVAPGHEAVTQTQRSLADIWCKLLNLEQVDTQTSFFALGGHSLMVTRLASAISRELGVNLSLTELFASNNIQDQAELIDNRRVQEVSSPEPAPQPLTRQDRMQLSYGQQRLWFLDRIEEHGPLYNVPVCIRLKGPLDLGALSQSLVRIFERHELFRSAFHEWEGEPYISFREKLPGEPDLLDLRGLSESGRLQRIQSLESELAQKSFDLEKDPLVSSCLVRVSDLETLLILNIHHIIFDGWSLEVLVRELVLHYQNLSRSEGRDPGQLPELAIQYADFAVWQKQWLSGDRLAQQLAYWATPLRGLPGLLELPYDRVRPPKQTFAGGRIGFVIDGDLTRRAHQLARSADATTFVFFQSLFALLLQRYSAREVVPVGVPISGRVRPELEHMIGFFVNTLVICNAIDDRQSFGSLLARIRRIVLEAFDHQDLPFEMLVDHLKIERSLSHSPVFQVLFSLQPEPLSGLNLADLELDLSEIEIGTAKFDLSCGMVEREGYLEGFLEYNRDLFEEATARRMVGHFQRLTAAVLDNPDLAVFRLDLLTPQERQMLLVDWNSQNLEGEPGLFLVERFVAVAGPMAHKTALVCGEDRLTYGQLLQRVYHLAAMLQGEGVGRESLVAVCLERDANLVTALLAIMLAGGAYVPLDPAWPVARMAGILADARPLLLLTRARLAELAGEDPSPRMLLDSCFQQMDPPLQPTRTCFDEDQLAWLIYTSGSTGKPKGVAIRHGAGRQLIRWAESRYTLKDIDGVLGATSICFDLSVFEILVTLARGGKLILAENALALAALPAAGEVRLINTVPSAMTELLRLNALPDSVRIVNLAGEPLRAGLVSQLLARGHVETVYNLYGPSEDTTYSTEYRAIAGVEPGIGRPLPGTRAYVLDQHGFPVPVGAPGVLCLGGCGLARGYYADPVRTAERFLPNPFDSEPGSRLYFTGDLVRWQSDGQLVFMGRVDHQIKLRGYRIELDEIDAALLNFEGVAATITLVRQELTGPRLVSYVEPAEGKSLNSRQLRQYLSRRLPAYMVPERLMILAALPQTPNGKIDRNALPAIPLEAGEGGHQKARTPTEEILVSLWCNLLGLDHVDVTTSFFDVGGHSLLATRLVSRIRNSLNVEVPLRDIFAADTIAVQAHLVDRLRQKTHPAEPRPLERVERQLKMPLSSGQQRLWFLDELEGSGFLYNMPLAMVLEGSLNQEALIWSLDHIGSRHEVLRTRFVTEDGTPHVAFLEQGSELRLIDLSQVSAVSQMARDLGRTEMLRPFDLSAGKLLRLLLLKLEDQRHYLILTMHHSISDGWSLGVLSSELESCYNAWLLQGRAPEQDPLPPMPVQYADYAVWQRSRLQGEYLQQRLGWWKQQLAGAPSLLELPTDRPRPAVQSFDGASLPVVLDLDLLQPLKQLGASSGSTLFMVLESLFALLLARYSRQTDIIIGSPIAGREREELEPLIGFFVNTLPMRHQLTGSPVFSELLNRTRGVALEAYAHQDIPFELIVEAVEIPRQLSHAPLVQVLLALQNLPLQLPQLGDLRVKHLAIDQVVARFELNMALVETESGLEGEIEYNTNLFDRSTIQRMFSHFRNLIGAVIQQPDRSIWDYELLSDQERSQILMVWNRTEEEQDGPELFHQIIEGHASRTPQQPALYFVDGEEVQTLTYGELNHRAERLAHVLVAEGVGPDDLVGIMVERSNERLVALFAVLKAGAAWVPLDPAYPQERLQYMIQDSGLSVLFLDAGLTAPVAGLRLHDPAAEPPPLPGFPLRVPISPENLSYVIYTSGSTGKPKGVLLHHRGLCNLARYGARVMDFDPSYRCFQFPSFSFDVSILDLATVFWAGASIWQAPRDKILPGPDLYQILERHQIHYVMMPPSSLVHMSGHRPSALRTLCTGGEACTAALAAEWADNCRFVNIYGPTECIIFSTTQVVENDGRTPPIGRPIANTRIYVVDAGLRLLPVGVPGELMIAGWGVGRGYLGRPGLTAERFLPDPYGPPGTRMYRTGDLTRYAPSGQVDYLGRIDNQVKLRGFRIELDEISTVLLEHEYVKEAVTLCRKVRGGDDFELVAYVVTNQQESEALPSLLKQHTGRRLPAFMNPSAIVVLEAMPLTPGGKIDRSRLPDPQPRVRASTLPANEIEDRIHRVWAEVLELPPEQVGTNDNFFDLGGHSLLIVRLKERLQKVLEISIPTVKLFEFPTITEQAAYLKGAAGEGRAVVEESEEEKERWQARRQKRRAPTRRRQMDID